MISLIFIFFASMFAAKVSRMKGEPGALLKYPPDLKQGLQIANVVLMCFAIIFYEPISTVPVDLFLYIGTWIFNYDIFYVLILRPRK